MNSAKTAVAENANHVIFSRFRAKTVHNVIGCRQVKSRFSSLLQASDKAVWIETFMRLKLFQASDLSNKNAIGHSERFGQFVLKNIAASGVGSRFEHGPDTLAWKTNAERPHRLANRGGMMREIVDDGDATAHTAKFEPPFDAFKGFECGLDFTIRKSVVLRRGHDGQSVAHI